MANIYVNKPFETIECSSSDTYVNFPLDSIGYKSSEYFFNFWQAQPRDDFEMKLYTEMYNDMFIDSTIESDYRKWLENDQMINISVYNWYATQDNIAFYSNYKRKHECI